MKHVLLLCMAVVCLLLITGCTQTADQGQPAAATTAAPTPTHTATTPVPAATITFVTATPGSVTDNTILIQSNGYTPSEITVKAGSIVRWVNKDKSIHSVMFSKDSKINPSGVLSASQSFSVKFYEAGTYPYYCGIHPKETGTVFVTP
ncbi:MAG: cupredoxin domain-containing protein [Methanoregula sp.]